MDVLSVPGKELPAAACGTRLNEAKNHRMAFRLFKCAQISS
jgi:hypothetical protein